jgi:hypothetical protein
MTIIRDIPPSEMEEPPIEIRICRAEMIYLLNPAGLHTALTRFMQIFESYLFSRAILNSEGGYVIDYP